MKIGILKNEKKIQEVVEVHMESFPGFFLTFLGKGFLRELYSGFLEHVNSNLIIAENSEGEIIGFLAYSENMSDFYKYLIKKKIIRFAWYAFCAFLKNPTTLFRLLRAFCKPGESQRSENYIELSSIGVLPAYKHLGVGSKLIQMLKDKVDFNRFKYIKLETDSKGNEQVNKFYQKNGFVLSNSYITPEEREMNVYKYYSVKNTNHAKIMD